MLNSSAAVAVKDKTSSVEQIWENWRDACLADHGQTTLPTHALADFLVLLRRKEAHHGFKNKESDEGNGNGRYHNQVTIQDPLSGQSLVFNIYTPNPISS